jgi:uncharacterized membrane protein YraQ (UPF0718 family)
MHVAVEALPLRRTLPMRGPLALVSLLVAVVLLRVVGLAEHPTTQTFAIVFIAIVVEALPFVLVGAVLAALLEVYVPDRAFAAVGRLPVALQLPAAALGGFAFPVCECGSVPVARRLLARGIHPAAGLGFMIASPIFNPIVLGSTWVAYEARGLGLEMMVGRAGLGLLLALVAGWAIGGEGARELLRSPPEEGDQGRKEASCCAHSGSKSGSFVVHLTDDFFYMGRFLILGAGLAATIQAFVPQNLVFGAASSPVLASLTLMVVAFVSSLCSEADAFVAVSFTPFPLGSQLAFLVFGPVLDFKLLFLYGATFRRRVLSSLAVVACTVTLAGALWFEVVMQ